jgi:hypothetical protein
MIAGFRWASTRCLYCASTGPHQWDHFPVPKRHGGTEMVRACLHCHNLKDRTGWPMFADFVQTQTVDNGISVSEFEMGFLRGDLRGKRAGRAAWSLLDDFLDFPPPIRLLIARRIGAHLDAIAAAPAKERKAACS